MDDKEIYEAVKRQERKNFRDHMIKNYSRYHLAYSISLVVFVLGMLVGFTSPFSPFDILEIVFLPLTAISAVVLIVTWGNLCEVVESNREFIPSFKKVTWKEEEK